MLMTGIWTTALGVGQTIRVSSQYTALLRLCLRAGPLAMPTALTLMLANGATCAAPLASNFYRNAMPQSWRGSWCETAPKVFTRCAQEHSDITITAAGFYAHETNCEHVQIIAPVRGSDALLNIKWMCRTSEDRSEPPWTVTWEAFLKDGRLYVKSNPTGQDAPPRP
jgi:hypothetical protein